MLYESFKIGDKVVYPAHGVGEIIGEEAQIVAGTELRVFIISLLKEKMTLRIPIKRATSIGLRLLCSVDNLQNAFSILQGKSKTPKGMWSKRVQEYETKINSGDVKSLAEVVRDLYKNSEDPDRSYSERVIYESALNRLASELAEVKQMSFDKAIDYLNNQLQEKEFAA
ncbi:MAG: CarD family transcriptional regulator [Rickettsiales bacterium]